MSKTLTITINNIPEDLWKDYWKYGIKSAKKDIGVLIEETDHIVIDAEIFIQYPEEYSAFMASAQSAHLIATTDKIINQ